MKNSELIEHVSTDMLDDRKNLISGEADHLFSDTLIARYLSEAENILARRAWVLEDIGATCATRIQLKENKADYPLDASVLFVKSVRLSDSDIDLSRVGYDDNRPRRAIDQHPDSWDVNAPYIENPGRPSQFSTDTGNRNIRIRQKPDAASALLKLHLIVVRLPLEKISVERGDSSPEIPEEYHLDLASYAAGKCLSRPTVDAELRTLGRGWIKDFETRVAEARRDKQRFSQSQPRHRFGGWVQGPDNA